MRQTFLPYRIQLSLEKLLLILLLTTLLIGGQIHAAQDAAEPATKEQQAALSATLERLTKAYGGKALRELNAVTIESDRRLAWPGQGQTATLVEFATDLNHKHFDLKRKHGSVERWIQQIGNVYHNRFVVTEAGGASINYFQNSVTTNAETTYWQAFSADYRMSDLLLAHLLTTEPPQLTYVGERRYGEHIHDVIKFAVAEDNPENEIYVSRYDGLIRRLFFSRDIGDINILFANHQRSDALAFASEIQVFIDDTLVEYESGLKLIPNADVSKKIAIEKTLSAPAAAPDMSEMTVDEIAEGAYLVGRDDYSLFVEHQGNLVAVNADAGLSERYQVLTKHLGRDLPLGAAILTHHHSDHIGGAPQAIELGAMLYVTAETKLALAESNPDIAESRQQVMSDGQQVGPFTVLIRGTNHSAENAFVFHPSSGALFQDDHYHGLVSEGPSRVQPTARILHGIIKASGLDVKYLLSGHARKAERWSVFDGAVNDSSLSICPSNRAICSGRELGANS